MVDCTVQVPAGALVDYVCSSNLPGDLGARLQTQHKNAKADRSASANAFGLEVLERESRDGDASGRWNALQSALHRMAEGWTKV